MTKMQTVISGRRYRMRAFFQVLSVLAFSALSAAAAESARVASVVDGDTVRLVIEGQREVSVRVLDLNTPETKRCGREDRIMSDCEPCPAGVGLGRRARAEARRILPAGSIVTVATRGRDRYGRVLGAITLPDGRDYRTVIIAAGLGVRYPKGKRPRPWCE
ncbi:MAG: thermonuclease family protein [Labrys sp. (in: a-proteobacteria)]